MSTERSQQFLRWLAVLAVVAFGLRTFSDNKADVDLWGNVGFVTSLPGSPTFHRTNTYSFTEPDRPWINHEWLSEYVLHQAHRAFGNPGLLGVKLLLGFLLAGLLAVPMTRACRTGPLRLLLFLLVISTIGYGFSTRPHLFSYVLYAASLILLQKRRDSPLFLFLGMPLMTVLWVNLHGAFFTGILLLLVLAAGSAADVVFRRSPKTSLAAPARLVAAAALCVLASLLNPYGTGTWGFLFQSAAIPRPYLSEWAPFNPFIHMADHADFVCLAILACTAALVHALKKRLDTGWAMVLTASLSAAFVMRRNIPLFAITAAVVAAPYLEELAGSRIEKLVGRISPAVRAVFLLLVILVSGWYVFAVRKQDATQIEVEPRRFPVQAVQFMKENDVKGNALVFFDWAEYCIWHLYPSCKVFMDGRFRSAYSEKTIDDYFDFLYRGPRGPAALREYPTDIVLLHRENSAHAVMRLASRWVLVFESPTAVLFVERDSHRELVRKIESGQAVMPADAGTYVFP
ncbi:MAG: hypothetical protein HQ559_14615 [Lentisphaerae bacterium]|nr:hypothetical protein [Lentisphaerota bacterium]